MKAKLQFDRRSVRSMAAVVAILLFGIFVTVQVLHAHPLGQTDESHCSICLAAHATPSVVTLPALPIPVLIAVAATPLEPARGHVFVSAPLFIRPPPIA